ncbi:MAG TPA: branched-chain amino acid ABC transporter permease [Solirubrobacter sp.]|nr:branched-chain amino acid ABC transporter permease [Solirubrobacter sp.]
MRRYAPVVALLVIALAVVPALPLSTFTLQNVNLAICYATVALSLNIVFGFAGQLSLGHGALFAVGAYTSAILTARYSWPFLPALASALVAGALAGLLIGGPSLRLRSHYFAFATLAFASIVTLVIRYAPSLTGGSDGLTGIPQASIAGYELTALIDYYYLGLAVLVLAVVVSANISGSRLGRALIAIREDELAAEASGLNVSFYKLLAFVVSAALAALAGSVYAHQSAFISPDVFGLDLSILLLAMVVVGGAGSIAGVLVGAALLTLLPEVLRFSSGYYGIIYGALIAVLMIFAPAGLAGVMRGLRGRRAVTREADPAPLSEGA